MIKIAEKGLFHSVDEFQILHSKTLGTGSFGVVKLALHTRTNRTYAIKTISLQNIATEAQLKLIQRQIRLHSQTDHPHIIKLWDTMIDEQNIYMILEYAENGNLFYYQNKKVTFPETEAFKFFMQTVEAIRYLQHNDILHRDLKPENLLLDADYNIKLCDFGWCTDNIANKKSTFCGTYEYMSPQMIFGREYDSRIDVWALGILLYEMLHGNAPFKGESVKEVKQRMMRGSYNLGSEISDEGKDLLTGILKFNPDDRLTLDEIVSHPWITKVEKQITDQLLFDEKKLSNKTLHTRICKLELSSRKPDGTPQKMDQTKVNSSILPTFHKKTSSMDIETKKNLNINLSINNYAVYSQKNNTTNEQHKPNTFSENKRKQTNKRCKTQNDNTELQVNREKVPNKKNHKKKEVKTLTHIKKAQTPKPNKPYKQLLHHKPSSKHRRSQEQIFMKTHNRYRTDMEISSQNITKHAYGLKKSRTKEQVQTPTHIYHTKSTNSNLNTNPSILSTYSKHMKSQNSLGNTQKLKKK